MAKKMLIDAMHLEESRMAIIDNNKLEEFDFETSTKKQLKGNIYLAKVVRIEPSLQAAFVEFGGNRHGFLAFSEIHPDYYRIPIEDREALMAAVARQASEDVEDIKDEPVPENTAVESSETPASDPVFTSQVEVLGGEDVEEIRERPRRIQPPRQYKMQEVIKRHQIMLVQVVKEERGGKGAALTTYLSLAGRYCVLMPNAAKGGGISRKITNPTDRKRLRSIIEDIKLPETMAVIIRTAGMARNKTEIKRDCDYLIRLWNEIRDKTLVSVAPALIYEEGGLIKRSIRDFYSRDIVEIIVEGEEAFKEARDFMRQLMPSHAKKVKQYEGAHHPLFNRYGIEEQIDLIHNPVVQLRSGGYIVFGTTEALVAIDVNSGRATRERHIEETAFRTNLEAAEEIARQLKLRDLAGLVVIDFIDMDESKNIELIEKQLKDAMRHDRARVQVGRISPFGLLELSRQRLRPNIIEATSVPCSICRGLGMVRSVESSALHALRAIEEEALHKRSQSIIISLPSTVALYLLNQKREALRQIEALRQVQLQINIAHDLIAPEFRIENSAPKAESGQREGASREAIKEQESRQPKRKQTSAERGGRFGENRFDRKPQQHRNNNKKTPLAEPESLHTSSERRGTPPSPEQGVTSTPPQGDTHPHRKNRRRRMRKNEYKSQPAHLESRSVNSHPQSQVSTKVANSSLPSHGHTLPASLSIKEGNESTSSENKREKSNTEKKAKKPRKGWWQRLLE